MRGAVLFSFPAAWFILTNFSRQNENSFHSEQELALFETNLESRGASVFPWFLPGAQTLLGALSTSELPDGHGAGPKWLACDTSKIGNKPVGWLPSGVRCFVAVF